MENVSENKPELTEAEKSVETEASVTLFPHSMTAIVVPHEAPNGIHIFAMAQEGIVHEWNPKIGKWKPFYRGSKVDLEEVD